jgi:hypothetical protein
MQEVTGSQWTFPDGREYTFIDKKLPFGSKLAPGIYPPKSYSGGGINHL